MPDRAEQDRWVERVLGFAPARTLSASGASAQQAALTRLRESLDQARSLWDGAYGAAQSASRDTQATLMVTAPREAKGMQRVLQSYWQDLASAIQVAKRAANDASEVVTLAGELRAEMQGDAMLDHLEKSGAAARPPLIATLDKIIALLGA